MLHHEEAGSGKSARSAPVTRSVDTPLDGFWLPARLRAGVLKDASWETVWLSGGALRDGPADGAVAVRWPRLMSGQWQALLAALQHGRRLPAGEVAARWGMALQAASKALLEAADQFLPLLSTATGYSEAMLATALARGNLLDTSALQVAVSYRPTWSVATRWERIAELPGYVRFFPLGLARRLAALRSRAPLYHPAPTTDLALGYAAGNIPGTALLIMLLGMLANQAAPPGTPAPAVLIRNSRHEPLFAPQVLAAIEAVDPELVAGTAVLVWDYTDKALQAGLMRGAGLMIAAAGDETIAALEAQRARNAPHCRFHMHGHKVSFSVIENPTAELATLAALDSSLWDQNGCLSPRVHFVTGDAGTYARHLTDAMRRWADQIPRGATPQRYVHRAFDSYAAVAAALDNGQIKVCSSYDDDFAVILDARPWNSETFRPVVNLCQGRVVVVRPVSDALEATRILRWLPGVNLQSVSVSLEPDHLMPFADAAGALGVSAIRRLGCGAFPQLTYSWDGLLPLDAGYLRPAGHFTTVEFDEMSPGS